MKYNKILVLALLVSCFGCKSPVTNVEYYPSAPGAEFDQRIAVSVNGRKVEADYFKNYHPMRLYHFYESTRARFAADGPVEVQVIIDGPPVSEAVVRTVGRDFPVEIAGSSLSFSLPGPGNYYLQLPSLAQPDAVYTLLFFVDDIHHIRQQEALLEREPHINVQELGVVSDPLLDQTSRIQEIFDKGGKIMFPRGIYRAGSLRIHSNTNLYLAKGAIIKGTDNYHLPKTAAFFQIDSAENIKVYGQGVIDANGAIAHDKATRTTVHGFNIAGSRNILFEDFTIQGTNSWCIDIRYSKFFTADNLKVFSGKDGFDPDASQDVILKNLSVQSLDDAFAIKNRYPTRSTTERILMKNCIVTSLKSSLKVGTETRALMRDIVFEDIDVYDGERGIVLYALDGGPIENVTWRNIRMSIIDWKHEALSGAAFHLQIKERQGKTPVRNCLIENVQTNFIWNSLFSGLPDAPLDGVKMKDIQIRADAPKMDSCYLFKGNEYVNLEIENLDIDWQDNREKWLGVSSWDGFTIKNENTPDEIAETKR